MKCKFCNEEKELILCTECYNFLYKRANESLHVNPLSIDYQIEALRLELEELKNVLKDFKIRGMRLKSTKDKLKR